jgi:hypothetical protein
MTIKGTIHTITGPTAFFAPIILGGSHSGGFVPTKWATLLPFAATASATDGSFSLPDIPVVFMMVGVSSPIGTSLMTGLIWVVAGIAAWVEPAVLPRLGHRGIGIWGFSTMAAIFIFWEVYGFQMD